ncbi:MAG: hypothetical protein HQ538_06315 [Parcubacteria group bacterium]|nr:hypothetical protein [Parcubacteria group bacterium]
MCKKKQFKYCPSEIDECMKHIIGFLNFYISKDWEIRACCCGHKKYPMTIVALNKYNREVWELISDKIIPRKRNFYKKDKQGYYYIPETLFKDKEKKE